MNKLCQQVSIESPGNLTNDCVYNSTVRVPDVPPKGARIKVICAGACYRSRRAPPILSVDSYDIGTSPYCGFRDAALFPGFEVAGVVDALGMDIADGDMKIGSRVVLYPFDDLPQGYPEYLVVPDLKYLIPIPNSLSLGVAATLPSGALLAKNAILKVKRRLNEHLRSKSGRIFKVLIVGTGGLALWAIRLAEHYFKDPEYKDRLQISVACLNDDAFYLKELKSFNLVQWNEEIFEEILHERTLNVCGGSVDVVINFGTTLRSLRRSLRCLNKGGVVFVSNEVADQLLPIVRSDCQVVCSIEDGTLSQLRELIENVATNDIIPPPHTEFPVAAAPLVLQKLCHSQIYGRAILRFYNDAQ